MKVLLINPSLQKSTIGHYKSSIEKSRGIYPPLGLCYVASALREYGCEVRIYDCDATDFTQENLVHMATNYDPAWIGIYTMTWTFSQACKIVEILKSAMKNAVFIAGGPNVTSFPEETLKYSKFDYAIAGEGEIAALRFVEMMKGHIKAQQVPALIYRKDDQILQNSTSDFLDNLDDLSIPARDLLPANEYYDVFTKHSSFITMITSRGCPYNCIYCDRKNRMGRKWRAHSAERILEEIEEAIGFYKTREVMFFDDEFIIDKERIYDFCNRILTKGIKIDWECRARVDQVDEKLLSAMARAGCYRIRFGFESGNDNILKLLRKGITVEQSIKCARISRKVGIEIFGYFMLGCPEETPRTVEETIKFALNLDLDFAIFSKAILIPGSELFEWGVANNQISSDYWQRYLKGEDLKGSPAISTKILPETVVDDYIKKANKEFYLRLSFLKRRILSIRSFSQMSKQIQMGKSLLFSS